MTTTVTLKNKGNHEVQPIRISINSTNQTVHQEILNPLKPGQEMDVTLWQGHWIELIEVLE